MRGIIAAANVRASKMGRASKADWFGRHAAEYRRSLAPIPGVAFPVGAPVVRMIEALALYADKHAERFESPIGNDYVLGVAWANIARGVRDLLNGEMGNLDCGTLDGMLVGMMEAQGIDPDTGVLGGVNEESR